MSRAVRERSKFKYRDGMPQPQRKQAPSGFIEGRRVRGMPMPSDPELPPAWDSYDQAAIRAVAEGRASAEQAKHFLDYVLYITRCYEDIWNSNPYLMARLSGARGVGTIITRLINTKTKAQDDSEHG